MQNIGATWNGLGRQRQILVGLASFAVFLAVLFLARAPAQKDMALLFGGLEPGAAGHVVTALDQLGTTYDVRGNAIFVPAADRDLLRMTLAGQGLPTHGSQGYELLDSLSGFSTTAQMFDAAYWRAKEGELARTILANPQVRAARVHISTPSQRSFQRDQTQTAAVTVTTAAGQLGTSQVRALQFLVSAAVPNMQPGDVAVIDDVGGLQSGGDASMPHGLQDERAAALKSRAERLLAARLGPGNAVVEVSVDTITERESIIERRVDPDSRIAISTDVTESEGTSVDSRGGGAVTVASNLPDGDGANSAGNSSNESVESRTLTNYEVSETERQLVRTPGAIRRLTVAVLINENPSGSDVTQAPRTPEELTALEALVASAVGLDPARGDVLTLRSMPFELPSGMGTEAAAPRIAPIDLDMMRLLQIGVLAVVALVLGLFVVRPILTSGAAALPPPATGDDTDGTFDPPMNFAIGGGDMSGFMGNDADQTGAEDNPVDRLRQLISDRQPETLQILQDWIDDPGRKTDA